MSLINSFLGSLPPSRRNSDANFELPLYHSPPSSPPSSAFPPPPVTSSVYIARPTTKSTARVPDHLLGLQRRAHHLQQQLQQLLDAQSDAILANLNSEAPTDDRFSSGSATPTVSSFRASSRASSALRRDVASSRKPLSLNAARRRIYNRIRDLATVKAEEFDFLDSERETVHGIWSRTESWSRKRTGLINRIQGIETQGVGPQVENMKREAKELEREIRVKEEELARLRTKHRRLQNEIADTENSVDARLASYNTALELLDKEVASFLARPPDEKHIPLVPAPFVSLPPKRRTLDMATEYWQEEHTRLDEKCEEVDEERVALEEGSELWKSVVDRVTEFEKNLQEMLGRHAAGDDPNGILTQLDDMMHWLEAQVDTATKHRWNPLVCSIGAELEAFKQGRHVLRTALGLAPELEEEALQEPDARQRGRSPPSPNWNHAKDMEDMRDGGEPTEVTALPVRPKPKFFDTDDEDPDPELLISHQDTDTD